MIVSFFLVVWRFFCMVFAVIATVANALVVSFIAQLFAAGDLIAFLVIEFLEMSDE